MKSILSKIREELIKNADEQTKKSSERFFKEKINVYGVKSGVVQKIANTHFKEIQNNSKKEILDLCEELFKSGYMEESFIACNWSDKIQKLYSSEDFVILEKWVNKYVSNWAECDTLCNHTIGNFVMKYPEYVNELKKWTNSKNRWVKRAAAVTLIIPARKGLFLKEIFEIADDLLLDPDDLVQKGYGWMLKAASQSNEKAVFDYVTKNKKNMPRTALRYAIEKMPKHLKIQAMAK
jgi:3-methyladenine DNA glycosylase AlkD